MPRFYWLIKPKSSLRHRVTPIRRLIIRNIFDKDIKLLRTNQYELSFLLDDSVKFKGVLYTWGGVYSINEVFEAIYSDFKKRF